MRCGQMSSSVSGRAQSEAREERTAYNAPPEGTPPRDRVRAVDIDRLRICEYRGFEALSSSYSDLLDAEGARNLHWNRSWLQALIDYGSPPGSAPLLLGAEDAAGVASALIVGFATERFGRARHCRALALHTGDEPYRPLVVAGLSPVDATLMVARYARRSIPAYDVLRISPLDVDGELFSVMPTVLLADGWIPRRFLMFPNWYEQVSGRNSTEYLRGRPSRLRNTIERRTRNLESSGRSRIDIIDGGGTLDTAIWDYERVFARSWKHGLVGLPYHRAIIQVAAQAGALRLALLYVDEKPAAAQFWIVTGGTGYLRRLAYDEHFRDLSPGTLLTWHVVRHLLDVDRVQELDLGVGDDGYKSDWASKRRERWGILAFNPRTWAGLKAASFNIGGRITKRLAGTVLRRERTPG
jgi:Acetyltransferase (GNAT) domain